MSRFKIIFSILLGLASTSSHSDIYGYVDGQGVSHFSAEKLDERYKLFLKSKNNSVELESSGQGKQPRLSQLTQHSGLKTFEPLLKLASQEYAVELPLLKAIMAAESGFNPAAISPKGAVGLMQVMPSTAERFGLLGDNRKSVEQKLLDPNTNIRLGARYLAFLSKLYPEQQELVIASYNAGEGAVRQYKNSIPPYSETQNYVKLVSQLYQVYQPRPLALKHGAMVLKSYSNGTKRIRMTIGGSE